MGAEASSLADGLPDGLLHAVAARAAQDQTHLSHLSGRERDEAARQLVSTKLFLLFLLFNVLFIKIDSLLPSIVHGARCTAQVNVEPWPRRWVACSALCGVVNTIRTILKNMNELSRTTPPPFPSLFVATLIIRIHQLQAERAAEEMAGQFARQIGHGDMLSLGGGGHRQLNRGERSASGAQLRTPTSTPPSTVSGVAAENAAALAWQVVQQDDCYILRHPASGHTVELWQGSNGWFRTTSSRSIYNMWRGKAKPFLSCLAAFRVSLPVFPLITLISVGDAAVVHRPK